MHSWWSRLVSQVEIHVPEVEQAAGPLYHRAGHLRDLLIVWTVVFRPDKIKYLQWGEGILDIWLGQNNQTILESIM